MFTITLKSVWVENSQAVNPVGCAFPRQKTRFMTEMVFEVSATDTTSVIGIKELNLSFQKLLSGELHTLYWGGLNPDLGVRHLIASNRCSVTVSTEVSLEG